MSKMIIVEGNSNDKDNVRVLMVKGEKGEQGDLNHNDIVDNLTSSATDKVLSANQGKILKDLVDSNKSIADSSINTITSTLTDLNEDISEETTNRTTADNNLQSQISSLASGSPLVASSTSGMTDTSRIYVNSSNGHWYYYANSQWNDGGVYQATAINDGAIDIFKLDDSLQNNYNIHYSEFLDLGTATDNKYINFMGEEKSSNDFKYYSFELTNSVIYKFIAIDYLSACGLIIKDSDNNIVFQTSTQSESSRVKRVGAFRANTPGLTAYVSVNKSSIIGNGYELTGLRTIESIYTNYSIESTPILLETRNGYYYGSNSFSPNASSVAYIYQLEPKKSYKITFENIYSVRGCTILDEHFNVLYQNTEIGEHTITYNSTNYGFIILSKYSNCELSIESYLPSVSDIETNVINKLSRNYMENVLLNKTIVFDGDSIQAGAGDTMGNGGAWAYRIAHRNNMTYRNYAVGGGTVTSDTYSYSTVTGTPDWSNTYYIRNNSATSTTEMYQVITEEDYDGTSILYERVHPRHWESTNISTIAGDYPNPDYVILESCLNDAFNSVPIGTISSGFESTYVTTNFASACEHMLQEAISTFPNAKIGVIICYRLRADVMDTYNQVMRDVCKKWAIPYLDLYRESGLQWYNETQHDEMFHDDTHINSNGYDFTVDKVENFIRSL